MWLLAGALAWASPEDEIVAAFTPRHADAPCAEVAASWPSDVRAAAFASVAEGVEVPPWVPVMAAACAAESAREPVARDAVLRWIADPGRAGLAVAAVHRLDALPESIAEEFAEGVVSRAESDARFADWVRAPLDASAHASVRSKARRLDP